MKKDKQNQQIMQKQEEYIKIVMAMAISGSALLLITILAMLIMWAAMALYVATIVSILIPVPAQL